MAEENNPIQCSNTDCRVSETGKCVEGFVLDKCPHIVRDTTIVQPVSDGAGEAIVAQPEIPLAKADCLSVGEATVIMRAAPTPLIGIVGPSLSGKTSLIASLCDLFQEGPVGDLQFAKCRTFFGFELACHHSRAASRRNRPESPHTSRAVGLKFYHLGIYNTATSATIQIMLADRSGEDYRAAADDPTIARDEFVEVQRADVLTILVDGGLMLDLGARHDAQQNILMVLQGLHDGCVLSEKQRLALVLTKLDIIRSASQSDQERVERDFEKLGEKIRTIFGGVVGEIRSFKTAASPTSTSLKHGFGVAELLDYWIRPTIPPQAHSDMVTAKRAIGRFGAVTTEPKHG